MKLKLAQNLRNLRLDHNITQEQLAEHLGVSFKTVSRWETGAGYPDIEMLPNIANFFDVSLENLLGVSKADRKMASEKMYQELSNLPFDCHERTELLLKMNKEFPDDRAVLYNLCRTTENLYQKRHFTNEMIRTANTDENGLDNHTARAIGWLIDAEEDENAMSLLHKYTRPLLLSRELRLESRARFQKNFCEYDLERQKNLLTFLNEFVFDRLHVREMKVEQKIDGLQAMIAMIDAMTKTIGQHPVSGDGVPDLWFPIRFQQGRALACHLASIGETNKALSIIEDLTDLHEKFWKLPAQTILTFRCSLLDKMEAPIQYVTMPTLFADDKDHMMRPARLLHIKEIDVHHVIWSYHTYRPYISGEWTGFNSIRQDPRLKACIQRMQQTEEEGVQRNVTTN